MDWEKFTKSAVVQRGLLSIALIGVVGWSGFAIAYGQQDATGDSANATKIFLPLVNQGDAQASAVQAAGADPVGRALGHLQAHPGEAKVAASDNFVVRDVIVEATGAQHVRFDRTYAGLRVIGGDIVVHATADGTFAGVSGTLAAPVAVTTKAALAPEGAIRAAAAQVSGQRGGQKVELVVYARGATPSLAYDVFSTGMGADGTPSELHVIVDAQTAAVLDSWDDIEISTVIGNGNGRGFFNGTVSLTTDFVNNLYYLRDPSRGNQSTIDMQNKQGGNGTIFTDADNNWGDGTLANRQTVGVDAQYGTAMTWDYYKNVHGRNGIANDGKGAYNRVHYGRNYNNAFWSDSCFCMTYGDGDGTTFNPFDSLDVAGHEMSHGVTSRTANLTYSGESGGLNEGTSDIFGTMVEFYANNANDPGDYLIGEELYKAGTKSLRSMIKPSSDGASADCWYSGVGSLNVHYSSGVANHFFHLLAEGTSQGSPTCIAGNTRVATGTGTLAGIGKDKAAALWYKALTVYMTASTNYAGARAATISAATSIYGANSPEVAAVAAAWTAVNRP